MGYDYWNHSKFLQHKVRNMVRRGWLLKTYNDEKMLRGRVKTGEKVENDQIDIVHPVGLVSHVKASDKHEVLTMDPFGDSSKRIVWMVMGDREKHPKPDENETWHYSPNEPKQFMRFKKKKDDQEQQQSRANDDKDGSGNRDSGREHGMHWDGLESRVTGTTKKSFANRADEGQGFETSQGSLTIKAGQNTQFEASKHLRKGEHHIEGTSYVSGIVHAADHYAGGGTSVQSVSAHSFVRAEGSGNGDQIGLDTPQEDGTRAWQGQGRPGHTSLLQTAAKVGTMGGMMGSLTGMMGMISGLFQQQSDPNDPQQQEQMEEMRRRLQELEEQLQQLQNIPDVPDG